MDEEGSFEARLVRAGEGEILGPEDGSRDRFMIDGTVTDNRLAVVEHLLGPHVLAGPLHRHSREDEFSYVLEGHVGVLLGAEELRAEPGDLVFKPRGQWHTFWNAGDEPVRILEIITPGGLERLFRRMGQGEPPELETLMGWAAEFGAEIDVEGTAMLAERHDLAF